MNIICLVAEVFGGTPAIGQPVVGSVATIWNGEDEAASKKYRIPKILLWQGWCPFSSWIGQPVLLISPV
jgi:hypothetical protein